MSYDFDRLTTSGETVSDVSGFGESIYAELAREFQGPYRFFFAGRSWTENFQTTLTKAGISTTANLWLSGAFAMGFIFGGVASLTILLLGFTGVLPLFVPSVGLEFLPLSESIISALDPLAVLLGIVLWSSGGAIFGILLGTGLAISYPSLRARARRRQIGLVLPDTISFMHSLAASGMSRMEIFRAVADAEDVYGEVSKEFQRIMGQVDSFDTDFHAAVEEVAKTSPNEDLSDFLTNLLSTINSGGDIAQELADQQEVARRQRKQQLESIIDYLELLGQMYMTLMLLPMLLVIILVITSLVGDTNNAFLFAVVYGLAPMVNLLFFVMISSVKQDEVGSGYIKLDDGTIPNKSNSGAFSFGPIEDYHSKHPAFKRVYRKEVQRKLWNYMMNPFSFFINHPKYLFFITVPAAVVGWAIMLGAGTIDIVSLDVFLASPVDSVINTFAANPIGQTIGWILWPMYATLLPYSLAYEWRERKRSKITETLPQDLRSLANTNQTGKVLPESLKIVAQDADTKLADEFGGMYKKLQMGVPLDQGLAEFNNKYHLPRLARMMKIVEKAQEVSTHIGEVLTTAAETAEYQAEIAKDRASRMTMQVVIVEASFLIFLVIMAGMDAAFVDFAANIIGDNPARSNFSSADPDVLSVMFIHTTLIQGFASGILAGYVKTNDVGRGVKYALFNASLVPAIWLLIPYLPI